ncbi:MAG TPA: tetratricopeptide repeat protein [Chitinophagaceae bacterium]|nr:tetratricopeptide repeat protein [Chitinophagaceae bacterium]HNF29039.1 tetratricopeptide repeat protein [Chitinophagaceae bacterium]
MKKIVLAVLLIFQIATVVVAQPNQTAKELHETARTFMRQGDYDNALLVIKRAAEQDPDNLEILKDLAFLYFLKRDYANAMQIGKVIIDRPDADVQSFQILGLTYKAIAEYKECKKLYKKALAKFPESGVIYNEYGELLAMDNDLNNAIVQWEKGIEVDANYSSNYYNAVKYYAQNPNPELLWIALHGENFVNLESYTARTKEIKKIILEAYKKMYAYSNLLENTPKKTSGFETAVLSILNNSKDIANNGINAESLMAIKARFVLDWFEGKQQKFPFRLFDHYQHMLKEGIFDAYNQWLYGSVANADAYELWIKNNDKQAEAFKKFQNARVYKIPQGQYYKK